MHSLTPKTSNGIFLKLCSSVTLRDTSSKIPDFEENFTAKQDKNNLKKLLGKQDHFQRD